MSSRYDHQKVSRWRRALHRIWIAPWRRFWIDRLYLKDSLSEIESRERPLAFYPLHTEPELTLHVYAREFVNQIEVIRLIASSLPIGTLLVIKEHPATVGRRKISYYRKLKEIPNVVLVKTATKTFDIIQGVNMVFVITGTTALEAIYLGKPVIYFGHVPFSVLPAHTVQKAKIQRLSQQIADFLTAYRWDEKSVLAFIAATMDGSVGVNLITEVLGKKRLNLTGQALSYEQNIHKLSAAFVARLYEEGQLGLGVEERPVRVEPLKEAALL